MSTLSDWGRKAQKWQPFHKKGMNTSGEDAEQQRSIDDYHKAIDEFKAGGPAIYNQGGALNWEDQAAGPSLNFDDLGPAQKLGDSGLGNVSTDPAYHDHELAALKSLEDRANQGFTASDRAAMTQVENQTNRANQGRIAAIMQNQHARGMGGGGMDLMAQLQSSQNANEIAAMKALEQEGMMQDRQQKAAMDLGQMSSQLQGRDWQQAAAKAQAQDAINQFNVQNANQTALYNNQNRNQANQANWQYQNELDRYNNSNRNNAAQANWQRANQTADNNANAQAGYRQNVLAAQQGGSQVNYNYAADRLGRRMGQAAADDAANSDIMGAAGGIAGAAIGGLGTGGTPQGAMAGYMIGSGAGHAIGGIGRRRGYSRGGQIFDWNILNGDDNSMIGDPETADSVPISASHGEIVLPADVAKSPEASANFVANENKKNEDTNNFFDSMRSFLGIDDKKESENSRISKALPKPFVDKGLASDMRVSSADINPLVEQFQRSRGELDKKVYDALDRRKNLDYVNVAGNIGTDIANALRARYVMPNTWANMGKGHEVISAPDRKWDSSMLDKLSDREVSESLKQREMADKNLINTLGFQDKQDERVVRDKALDTTNNIAILNAMGKDPNLLMVYLAKKKDDGTITPNEELILQSLLKGGKCKSDMLRAPGLHGGVNLINPDDGTVKNIGGPDVAPRGSDPGKTLAPIEGESAAAYKARIGAITNEKEKKQALLQKKEQELHDAEAARWMRTNIVSKLTALYAKAEAEGHTGPFKGRIASLKQSMGIGSGDASNELQLEATRLANDYIRKMTGATVGQTASLLNESEQQRLMKVIPSGNMDHDLFPIAVKSFIAELDALVSEKRAAMGSAATSGSSVPSSGTRRLRKQVNPKTGAVRYLDENGNVVAGVHNGG